MLNVDEIVREIGTWTNKKDVPNETTLKAIKEAEAGKMASFSSIDELMEDLND